MGPERRSVVISEDERKVTAYHESGHAILGMLLPNADPVHKVTIIPRGLSLGLTQSLPETDKHNLKLEYINDQITLLMGGRVAEEIVFGKGGITTGAQNDIERATKTARKMVCEWGMSDKLGPLQYGQKEEPIFIGKEIARHKDYSEKTSEIIDNEIKEIVESAYKRAWDILSKNKPILERLAKRLLEKEILDRKGIEEIVLGNRKSEKQLNAAARKIVGDGEKDSTDLKNKLGIGNIKIATNEASGS
jgi:cell division protease FtsH